MDDRSLKEYALNIFKGIRGYTLSKALSLFPKYYPKIAFYYAEMLTKQQNEFSLRMIQGLGIDKGRALLNELNDLNAKTAKFYANAKFKLDQSYRRIESATDEDRDNIVRQENKVKINIMNQSTYILNESTALFKKIKSTAKQYNFVGLENEINTAEEVTVQASNDLINLNIKFDYYIRKYQI